MGTTSGEGTKKSHLSGHLAMPSLYPLFSLGLDTAHGGCWGGDQLCRRLAKVE